MKTKRFNAAMTALSWAVAIAIAALYTFGLFALFFVALIGVALLKG